MEIREILNQRNVPPSLRLVALRLVNAADQLRDTIQALRDRVSALEDGALTITVVPALTDLPANAEPTQWFRVVADPAAVYVGNGMTRPLSRFTTTPV